MTRVYVFASRDCPATFRQAEVLAATAAGRGLDAQLVDKLGGLAELDLVVRYGVVEPVAVVVIADGWAARLTYLPSIGDLLGLAPKMASPLSVNRA